MASTLALRKRLLLINSQKEFTLLVSARGRRVDGGGQWSKVNDVDGLIQPHTGLSFEGNIHTHT